MSLLFDICICTFDNYSTAVGQLWSIAISLSVCLFVRLSASISLNCWPIFTKFTCADPLWPWLGPPVAALGYIVYLQLYG